MARQFDCCGGIGKHLGGCTEAAGNPDGSGNVSKPSRRCNHSWKNMDGNVMGVARHNYHVCGIQQKGHAAAHVCNVRGCGATG